MEESGSVTTPEIPADLLPSDGRFGSGPAKIRPEAVQALAADGAGLLGTSHRQPPVRNLVGDVRDGLAELFAIPAGYEVVLGNGGSTFFWDVATFSLIERRSAHASFGEFSAKFAAAAAAAPHLDEPQRGHGGGRLGRAARRRRRRRRLRLGAQRDLDRRHRPGRSGSRDADPDALVVVDGTSAAAAPTVDISATDVYYFAPQKSLGSDGGLWLAIMSPAALDRVARIAASGRWIPDSLSLQHRDRQLAAQPDPQHPGDRHAVPAPRPARLAQRPGRTAVRRRADGRLGHAGSTPGPRLARTRHRSSGSRSPLAGRRAPSTSTGVDAATIAAALRANGVVDTEPYRKLGRNQLRIGMYPSVEPDDVSRLTRCIDWLIADLSDSPVALGR